MQYQPNNRYLEMKRWWEERKAVMKDPNPERRVRYGLQQTLTHVERIGFLHSPVETLSDFVIEELPHVKPDMRRTNWRSLSPPSSTIPGLSLIAWWVDLGRHESNLRWGDFLGLLYCEVVRPRRIIPEYEKCFPYPPQPWTLRSFKGAR